MATAGVTAGVTAGRGAHGRFLVTATADLLELHGSTRVRQVGEHAWVLSRVVDPGVPGGA